MGTELRNWRWMNREVSVESSRSAAGMPVRTDGEVVEARDEGAGNWRLRLRVPGWPRQTAPGQFLMLTPGGLRKENSLDPLLPRPMAIYRAELDGDGAFVEIRYKVVGRGTRLLASAEPGDIVGVVGPLGNGFPMPAEDAGAILVAGGTGVASVFELAAAVGGAARVLLGARSAADFGDLSDFEQLPAELRLATEDGSRGAPGFVTELLPAALEEGDAPIYVCGPTPMMRAVAEIAASAGRRCWVSLENPMACGFGVCLGCAAPLSEGGFALVCRDGPVFEAGDVDWERLA